MTKTQAMQYVTMGQVGATYGVKGWLKILSYADKISALLDYQPWFIESGEGWVSFKIEDARLHGKGLIVKLEGFDNPEEARGLSGKKIAILRSQLPELPQDEYYWNDLKGLTVINKDGSHLGKVIYLMETGSNDVIVVKGEREHAIPYLPGEIVLRIDLEKGEMYVDWDVI